jgi:hypothetical protein
MTFHKYAAFFEPDELAALTAAYDAVWQHLWTTRAINETQASVIKDNLAQIILASACTGERDRERLTDIALRAVTGSRRMREPAPSHC